MKEKSGSTTIKPRFRIPLCALIAAIILTVICPSANATSYFFLQSGYTGGGTITGAFEGTDMNGDGRLVYMYNDPGEISSFSLIFSGDSIVSGFKHTLSDVYGLVYDIGSGYIGDRSSIFAEGIASNWGGKSEFDYASGWGPTGSFGGRVIDVASGALTSTSELVVVTTVPIPDIDVASGAITSNSKLVAATTVPIPGAVWLLGSGLLGLVGLKKKFLG